MDYNLQHMPSRELIPGLHGKLVHGTTMSLAFWEVEAGAEVPAHAHEHEQVMHVIEGRFSFTLDGETREYGPGELVVIPPNALHSGKALTACRLLDVFSPVRDDYKE